MTRYKVTKEVRREVDCLNNIEIKTRYYVKESVFLFLWGYVCDYNNQPVEFFSKKDAEDFLIKYRDAFVSGGDE